MSRAKSKIYEIISELDYCIKNITVAYENKQIDIFKTHITKLTDLASTYDFLVIAKLSSGLSKTNNFMQIKDDTIHQLNLICSSTIQAIQSTIKYNQDPIDQKQIKEIFDQQEFLDRLGTTAQDAAYINILQDFIQRIPNQIQILKQAIQNQNHEQRRLYSHKLKGTFANISAKKISKIACQIESDKANHSQIIDLLEKEFLVLKSIIEKECLLFENNNLAES